MMIYIFITTALFIIFYPALVDTKLFKAVKNKYISLIDSYNEHKYKKIKSERLSSYFPDYWMWKRGDIIVVLLDHNLKLQVELETFSSRFIIARRIGRIETDQTNIFYPKNIVENTSHEKRLLLKEAKNFQENDLPEIIQNNINDLKLLNDYEKKQSRYNLLD